MSETQAEIDAAFIDAVEASLGSLVPKCLYDLARRGAAVQAALPAGPISQAQYNEALLTVSRLTETLRIVRDLNKSAEGWIYSQAIEDEIAEAALTTQEKTDG